METLKKVDKVVWTLFDITLGVFGITGAFLPLVISTKWMHTPALVNIGLMVFFAIVGACTHVDITVTERNKGLKALYPNCF